MSSEIAARDNADWGRTVEVAACGRWPLDLVSDDRSEPDWFDAVFVEDLVGDLAGTIIEQGTRVEVKACRLAIESGRSGRWWFRRSSHEQLVASGGEYVLGAYNPGGGVLRMVLVEARSVDVLLAGRWTSCGRSHRATESAQLPWSAVLDSVDGSEGSA